MWRVVLDSATLTSALLNPHGSPARLLDFALQGQLRLFVTPRIVATAGKALCHVVLARQYGPPDSEIYGFIEDLPVLLCIPHGLAGDAAHRTPEEEILDCVNKSNADFLVLSGSMNAAVAGLEGTQIVTADQLVELIGR